MKSSLKKRVSITKLYKQKKKGKRKGKEPQIFLNICLINYNIIKSTSFSKLLKNEYFKTWTIFQYFFFLFIRHTSLLPKKIGVYFNENAYLLGNFKREIRNSKYFFRKHRNQGRWFNFTFYHEKEWLQLK